MTIAEIEYTDYVSSFVGIPYVWNSWDKEKGLDCRTLIVLYLRGRGYEIDALAEDGFKAPSLTDFIQYRKDRIKNREFYNRCLKGIKAIGLQVDIDNIREDDIIMYETSEALPHFAVCVEDGGILTTTERGKSFTARLSKIATCLVLIVRPPEGAIRWFPLAET